MIHVQAEYIESSVTLCVPSTVMIVQTALQHLLVVAPIMFSFLAPYPSALLPSGPALSSEHVPTSSQVSLLPSLSQTISFAILNSDLPISTTSRMPASPHSTRRTRQSKRSTYILPHTLLHLLLSLLH